MRAARVETESPAAPKDRRQEIVEKAREVLAELGPAALSMRRIADDVGIKLASLQYHFPSKAALIGALAEDIVRHYDEYLLPFAEVPDDPEQKLSELIRWIRTPKGGEWRLIQRLEIQFVAMALVEPVVAEAQSRFFAGYRQVLSELISAINPHLSEAESLRRAALMSVMIDGCSLIEGEPLPVHPDLEGLTEELIVTALELARRPPRESASGASPTGF